jgi:putative glutamine amidotransferase
MTSPVFTPLVRSQSASRPAVVGISGGSIESASVQQMMAQVRAAGGIPMLLANHAERNAAEDIQKIDALMVMGNDFDVDPARYVSRYAENDPRRAVHPQTKSTASDPAAAARAAYEEQLLTLAAQKNMPTLAICGGMQLLNVMHGGGILQHIPDQIGDTHHQQNTLGIPGVCPVIPVTIQQNTSLGTIAGNVHSIYTASIPPAGEIGTTENSFHHQAIDPDMVGNGLRIVASSDSFKSATGEQRRLPEAIEPDPAGPLAGWPLIGVQWHPEFGSSTVSTALIAHTVSKGREYARTSTRDASFDGAAAMAANLRSSKKADAGFVKNITSRIPGSQTIQL